MLLVLALIWPFALATIQFSDPFVPQTASECEFCIEVKFSGLVGVWVCLLATVLILPFWGILMLIRCKLKLDRWLEYALARLNRARQEINEGKPEATDREGEDQEHDDTLEVVGSLVNMVAECQEYLALIWTHECGWLVHASTSLLWVSAAAALMLTAESVWLFLVNKGEPHSTYAPLFAIIVFFGLASPLAYLIQIRTFDEIDPPSGYGEEFSLARTAASARGFEEPEERRRRASQMRKSASSPNFSESPMDSKDRADSFADSEPSPAMEWNRDNTSSSQWSWFCARRNTKKPVREPLLASDWRRHQTENGRPHW